MVLRISRINRFLVAFIKISCLVILFLPLAMNSQFFFPFIVVKNVLFRIIVELIFGAYLFLAFTDPAYRPRWDKITWLVIGFFIVSVVAGIFGIGFSRSLWGNYERMSGLFHHLHLVLYFLVVANIFKDKKDWQALFTFSVFTSLIAVWLAYAQWLEIPFLLKSSGGARLTGTVGNAAFFATYLLFNLFFLLYFLARSARFNFKVFALSSLVLDLYLIGAGILYKIFATVDWHAFNFLKYSFLNQASEYPQLVIPFLIYQLLILGAWIFKKNKFSVFSLLLITFFLEFFIFYNTQTRGAIIGFLAVLPFLALVGFYRTPNRKIKWLYLGFIGLVFIAQLLMYQFGGEITNFVISLEPKFLYDLGLPLTRIIGLTALVGFYLSLLLVVSLMIYFVQKKPTKILASIFLTLLLLTPPLVFSLRNQPWLSSIPILGKVTQLFEPEKIEDITTQSRLLTWQASWRGWRESPKSFLLGFGPENYYYAFNKNFPQLIYQDAGSQVWFDRAHNIIFDVGVTTGLAGLIVYLSLLVLVIRALITRYHQADTFSETWLFVGFLAAYFIQNFFVFDTLNSEILFYLLLGFIVFLAGKADSQPAPEPSPPTVTPPDYYWLAGSGLILLFLVIFNIKTLQANHYIYQALVQQKPSAYRIRLELLEQAIDKGVIGRFEAREQLANFALDQRSNQDIPVSFIQAAINKSIDQLEKSIAEEPWHVRHYLFLATIYNGAAPLNKNYPDAAISLMEKAQDLSPTRPQIYFEIGQAYIFKGDFDRAIEYFQQGVDIAPWVAESQLNLLALAIIAQKNDLAEREFGILNQVGWRLTVSDYQRFIDLYGRNKDYKKIVGLYQEIIKLEPNNAEHYAQLAAVYAKLGQNQEAKAASQKAVELNPSFAAESQKFLELLDFGQLIEK